MEGSLRDRKRIRHPFLTRFPMAVAPVALPEPRYRPRATWTRPLHGIERAAPSRQPASAAGVRFLSVLGAHPHAVGGEARRRCLNPGSTVAVALVVKPMREAAPVSGTGREVAS